jgi:hypothetical protein
MKGGGMLIKSVPLVYRGVQFRSSLEADWAATFDSLDWTGWEYEPVAVEVEGQAYLCDFHLPNQRVWCEVKGPHDEGLHKTRALYRALEPDPWNVTRPLVVVLRAAQADLAIWEGVSPAQDLVIAKCPECQHFGWLDTRGAWACRWSYGGCNRGTGGTWWQKSHYRSGDFVGRNFEGCYYYGHLPFVSAPRPPRRRR